MLIYLRDGLTIGRGNAHVLLDGEEHGAGMGRVHATIGIPDEHGPVVHCHSVNKCRVENRGGGLSDRNVAADHNARLTEGCTLIFASSAPRALDLCPLSRCSAPARA